MDEDNRVSFEHLMVLLGRAIVAFGLLMALVVGMLAVPVIFSIAMVLAATYAMGIAFEWGYVAIVSLLLILIVAYVMN